MSKNIYNLFREYNKLNTDTEKSKYIASLNYDTKATFKSLISYASDSKRFDTIYDGWIDSLDEEIVVLEVYSVVLNTQKSLKKFCVDDKAYKEFISNKKKMLFLLLKNKQYEQAAHLLEVYIFSKEYEKQKLEELKEEVLKYLIVKKMVLPKKLLPEIYRWIDELIIPSYLATDIDGDFKFLITNRFIAIETLKEEVEKELMVGKLKDIVDNLVEKNSVK